MDLRRFLEARNGQRSIRSRVIPAVQKVLTAARGATDAFSGVGRHVNSSLKKLGFKNIEVDIGCRVGLGHGFGVGPGQSGTKVLNGTPVEIAQLSSENVMDLKSGSTGSSSGYFMNDERPAEEARHSPYASKETPLEKSVASHTEKVINSFLQDPLFKDAEVKLNEVAGNLCTENDILQMLLKHQQAIEELIEENRKLRQILVEDFKVSPCRLQTMDVSRTEVYYPCSDCFKCRRRRRKAAR
ncbi:hypothetical protein MUK42_19043 [Musa troglodytarum]|uniref:Uncharacterized protein n=1 Tax=Musa troglodytarum TaxID=320322 RepID=A0A9E7F2W6_9LILI|nr:hypothetical protein MUK42_19043 [Musa troglodytarum]